MLPVLQIGPLALPVPGMVLITGMWLGLTLAEKHAHRHGISAEQLFNLALVTIIAGVVGARLVYIARYPSAFTSNPLDVFSRNPGLLDPLGGMASAGIVAWVSIQRRGMPLLATLDASTPLFALMYLAMGISHLASGNFYGLPADLPWAIELWDARRHPTQVYEIIAALFLLISFWPARATRRFHLAGQYFFIFFAASSLAWLIIEGFRADSYILPGGIRAGQALAWLMLAASLWGSRRIPSPNGSAPATDPQAGGDEA